MKFSYFLILLVYCFLMVSKALASTSQDITINYPTINSTSQLYPVKRLWEKAFLYIMFSKSAKVDYSEGLLKERLSELKYVAEKKLPSEIENSSNKFAYQAGITIDELKNLNNKNKINKILDEFKSYNKILVTLRDLYKQDSSYWRLIQQDIDTLNILSDKIKNIN